MMAYALERQIAISAVERAMTLTRIVESSRDRMIKSDASPVTIADYGSQALINHILSTSFNDPIVAEEDTSQLADPELSQVVELVNRVEKMTKESVLKSIDLGKHHGGSGRFWTLDPIDGTKGFLRGEQYAVCLALIEHGQVQVGVLGCPNLPHSLQAPLSGKGSIFAAVRGQGAFERRVGEANETPIHVSNERDPSKATICESYESGHSSQNDNALISKLLGISKPPVRLDSQCKYALVARGDADIYSRLPVNATYQEKIWDHAAGSLIVHEAGGQSCDLHSNPLDFSQGRTLKSNSGVIVTNGHLHPPVMSALFQVLSKENSKI